MRDEPDVSPHLVSRLFIGTALEEDLPGGGTQESGGDAEQRRFPGAVSAEEDVTGSRRKLEIDVAERSRTAEPLRDTPRRERGSGRIRAQLLFEVYEGRDG
jgi:hypothetical protein